MSRPTPGVPLQATLNKWVNVEAVMAYADKMRAMAKDELDRANWNDDLESLARSDDLNSAAEQLDKAIEAANAAHMAHERAAYDRIYRRRQV